MYFLDERSVHLIDGQKIVTVGLESNLWPFSNSGLKTLEKLKEYNKVSFKSKECSGKENIVHTINCLVNEGVHVKVMAERLGLSKAVIKRCLLDFTCEGDDVWACLGAYARSIVF